MKMKRYIINSLNSETVINLQISFTVVNELAIRAAIHQISQTMAHIVKCHLMPETDYCPIDIA